MLQRYAKFRRIVSRGVERARFFHFFKFKDDICVVILQSEKVMTMKKYLIVLLSLLTVAVAATAQAPAASVKWRTSVRMTSPGEGVVTVRAIIPDGWHLYGTHTPEGGPKATVLDFGGSTGVVPEGNTGFSPAPTTARDEAFGMDLQWWEGRVAFTQRFRVTDAEKARISLKITYMSCNGLNCNPPRTESISAPVPPFKKK